jgi:hypothetical protein
VARKILIGFPCSRGKLYSNRAFLGDANTVTGQIANKSGRDDAYFAKCKSYLGTPYGRYLADGPTQTPSADARSARSTLPNSADQ